jgi:hypothetical protein
MNRKLFGPGAAVVSRMATALLALTAWCAPAPAPADAAVTSATTLDKSAYNNPNGNTHVVCLADASQSYELYIPDSVTTAGPAPIFYGFDPGGNGKSTLLVFAAAAAANGWILAVSNNSMNGPWTTIFTAQDAVITDTEARLNLSPTRRFAGGLSGGGRTALALAFRYPSKICGVLPLGAGWPVNTTLVPSTDALNVCMIIGTQDSNYTHDIPDTQGKLIDAGIRCVVKTFNGGHVWPSADMILAGCQWLNMNAEIDPNSGLAPATCPARSLFCQPPSPVEEPWATAVSNTHVQQSLYESFREMTLPIATLDWWGISATYNGSAYHWLPCDPPADRFAISLHPDNGGTPGAAVHQETVTAIREDLPQLYSRNYPLSHYRVTLSSPVTLASGWVRIQQVGGAVQCILLLDSPSGDGQCLMHDETNNTYTPYSGDLAVSLRTEDMTVGMLAAPWLGRPPLTVQFAGNVTDNVLDIINWRWEFGDGDIVEGGDERNPIHTYDAEGAYDVTLTVSTNISTATTTRHGLVVVTEALPLTTPAVLASLLTAFSLLGVAAIRHKKRAGDS